MNWTCFRCGEPGHVVAECMHPSRSQHPPAPPASRAPDLPPPPPPWRPADPEVARRGSAAIKAAMGWEDSPVVRTPFREVEGLMPKTEGQLRQLARGQVAESRAARLA